jgi:hypothetical protein
MGERQAIVAEAPTAARGGRRDMSERCDGEVFENGVPLLLADTGPVGGSALFEKWVQDLANESGQRVDWHYSGGVAQVLVLGDYVKALAEAMVAEAGLPAGIRIMRWCGPAERGLYRAGVTPAPDDAIAAVFIRSDDR